MRKTTICVTVTLFLSSMATADTTRNLLARTENQVMKEAKTLDQLSAAMDRLQTLKVLYNSCRWELQEKKIPYDCYEYNLALQHFPNSNLRKTHIENLSENCVRWSAMASEEDFRPANQLDSTCLKAVNERMKIVRYKKLDTSI